MAARLNGNVLRLLDTLNREGTVARMSDGQLLERFLARPGASGEAAFEALVRRRGPRVLALCLGVLRDEHDAEDAFQAILLVLACRAATVRDRDRLATLHTPAVAPESAPAPGAQAARRAPERQVNGKSLLTNGGIEEGEGQSPRAWSHGAEIQGVAMIPPPTRSGREPCGRPVRVPSGGVAWRLSFSAGGLPWACSSARAVASAGSRPSA